MSAKISDFALEVEWVSVGVVFGSGFKRKKDELTRGVRDQNTRVPK